MRLLSIRKTQQKYCHVSFNKSTKCVSCQLSPLCETHVFKVLLSGKHFKVGVMTEVVCARSENTFILKAAVSAMCNPPQPGDESYGTFLKVTSDFHILLLWFFSFFFLVLFWFLLCLFTVVLLQKQQVVLNALLPLIISFSLFFFFLLQEKRTVLDSYRRKAKFVVSMLRSLEGVVCKEINGSLYAFPSIKLPRKAAEAAKVRSFESSALHIDQIFFTFCVKEVLAHNLFK